MAPPKIILIVVVLCLLIVVTALIGWKLLNTNPMGASEYSAVYLTSGDIYFGKLDWFPWPRLKNVWFVQKTALSSSTPQFSVVPFKNIFWGLIDEIVLHPNQILFTVRLRNDSQMVQALRNPDMFNQPQPQSLGTQELSGTPTTTQK